MNVAAVQKSTVEGCGGGDSLYRRSQRNSETVSECVKIHWVELKKFLNELLRNRNSHHRELKILWHDLKIRAFESWEYACLT